MKVPTMNVDPAKQDWEYVEIPETDLFDHKMVTIQINRDSYGPGTHLVDPDVASELRRILRTFQRSQMGLLHSTPNQRALDLAVSMGSLPQAKTAHEE